MKRRGFFATLLAPLVAKFVPEPVWGHRPKSHHLQWRKIRAEDVGNPILDDVTWKEVDRKLDV